MLEILSLTSQLRTKLSMAVDDLLAQLLRGIQMPPSAGK